MAGFIYILIPAFFVYFFTESVLRQVAVCQIRPETVNVSSIMSQLPSSIRDSINRKVTIGQLKDAIARALGQSELIFALSNYAEYSNIPEEKEKIFRSIIDKYPSSKEASRAFVFFFINPNTKHKISISEYHAYIKKFSQLDQYYMWVVGLSKMRELKLDAELQYTYLAPLLDIKPEYRDFAQLFDYISELAVKLKNDEAYDEAKKLETASYSLPYIDRIIEAQLKKEEAAVAAKEKKDTKASGLK